MLSLLNCFHEAAAALNVVVACQAGCRGVAQRRIQAKLRVDPGGLPGEAWICHAGERAELYRDLVEDAQAASCRCADVAAACCCAFA